MGKSMRSQVMSNTAYEYFSLKVAKGKGFCNRDSIRKEIVLNFHQNEHMVVVAPRRYGKTSLIMKSLSMAKISYAMIDLFCVSYQEEVARKLARAVSEIARQLMGTKPP